jgi:hypothetical protein
MPGTEWQFQTFIAQKQCDAPVFLGGCRRRKRQHGTDTESMQQEQISDP